MDVRLRKALRKIGVFVLASVALGAGPTGAQDNITLVATGSSMPEPLYAAWIEEFHKAEPKVQLRYLAEGTAESAARILAGAGDFGGGDLPSESPLVGCSWKKGEERETHPLTLISSFARPTT